MSTIQVEALSSDVIIRIPRPSWPEPLTHLPNLAVGLPLIEEIKSLPEVDAQKVSSILAHTDEVVEEELKAAGLKAEGFDVFRGCGNGYYKEVPTKFIGTGYGWTFKRAWRYYIAEGPGIPPQLAQIFWQKWGGEVRTEGHCGCPSPYEWLKGFAVGSYHIDTQAGLNAFVDLLKSIRLTAEGYSTRP